ncbi:GDSL-type esterase/lipase family protein [Streptomyces sp. DSM 44917]|uniref:GDSL-type esterase/lipase family protein n=1 Tax=Streptomyces boetiae TaxID=3075541 RepID=A0ABU2LG68_9ACTN|nr:GDSL-type esterase/lipase family protein [Streptomyces sp. DSM 44917]MDT0310581.1 GDSL-type esterase/lipase family protein [Streptomyces sp. DSM 44917]
MERDVRLCFVGDSFVAGVGDPQHLGWAGRLCARAHAAGVPLTAYNLGVRRQTSAQILGRWLTECAPRLAEAGEPRLVLAFGVNDTTRENGRPRVEPAGSQAHLARMLQEAAARGWSTLVAGPPPVDDAAHNARTAVLDARFAAVCRDAGVPYVPVLETLSADAVWRREVRAGDGAHPGAGGYDALAALIAPHWDRWLATPPARAAVTGAGSGSA